MAAHVTAHCKELEASFLPLTTRFAGKGYDQPSFQGIGCRAGLYNQNDRGTLSKALVISAISSGFNPAYTASEVIFIDAVAHIQPEEARLGHGTSTAKGLWVSG